MKKNKKEEYEKTKEYFATDFAEFYKEWLKDLTKEGVDEIYELNKKNKREIKKYKAFINYSFVSIIILVIMFLISIINQEYFMFLIELPFIWLNFEYIKFLKKNIMFTHMAINGNLQSIEDWKEYNFKKKA